MTNLDMLLMAGKNLWRRKLRTFLTVLGVIIGCASIVIMLSFAIGIKTQNEKFLESMGNLKEITINNYHIPDMMNKDKVKHLNKESLSYFKNIPHVAMVSPKVNLNKQLRFGKYSCYLQPLGMSKEYFEKFDKEILFGEKLYSSNNKFNVIIPKNIYESCYDDRTGREPYEVNKELDFSKMLKTKIVVSTYFNQESNSPFEEDATKPPVEELNIVGIYEPGESFMDNYIYMLDSDTEKLLADMEKKEKKMGISSNDMDNKKKNEYEEVLIQVDDVKNVRGVMDQLIAEGYQAHGLIQQADNMNKQMGTISAILGGIGSISLFVAAIGIANTMIMSIYERVREIGVMKVVGASIKDIRKIFLLEAALIGFLGGCIGLILSLIVSYFLNNLSISMAPDASISVIPVWLMFLALGFSSLIGLISGYLPAQRATNISAIDAIRSE